MLAPPLEEELPRGYVCARCNYHLLERERLFAAEAVRGKWVVFTYLCPCSPSEAVTARYVMVPDLMYLLFRERMLKLPFRQEVEVSDDHPALVRARQVLDSVETLEDIRF